MGKVPFKASERWLCRYKDRHGIHCLNVQGETLSTDTSLISWCVKSLKGKIEERQLCPEQIYNADKTGVYWNAMPRKTLVAALESAVPCWKEPKDRVTVLVCSNATGTHKLKLLLIMKYGNPRCLKLLGLFLTVSHLSPSV